MFELKDVVAVEAELNPGAIEEWLKIIQQGNKKMEAGTRRSDLSTKVKKHLSALGWVISYAYKGKKRELRYKSPKGRWYYSLASACMSCVNQQQQIVGKFDLPCSPIKLHVSNLEQKKKRKRVQDSDTAAFNTETPKRSDDYIEIILNIDPSDEEQVKRRKTTDVVVFDKKGEVRPRIGKSLKNVLQVMEKKNEKGEMEYLRFWRKDCGADMNCDVCCICHWGGDLILCDGCPSAFHHTCLGLSKIPKEELWFCPCCCCDICGSMDSIGNSKLMSCEQCQRRFHLKCLKEEPCLVSHRGWFCSSQCNRVYTGLQNLLGCKIAVCGKEEDLVWTLMRAPDEHEHYDDEQMSKLNSAVKILHEGFEPSKDPNSGRDLVEELIYQRDRNGVGRGFYTVLIERKNEPITVAAIRVDKDVAEVPLVSTLPNYRRSGMCRVLMSELEKQMTQMGVVRLVLPAAADVVTTWTERFGFSVMESSHRLEAVKHGMLDFVGTVMCYKNLMQIEQVSGDSGLTD